MLRRLVIVGSALVALFGLSSCGTGFKLPAEVHRDAEVGNGNYVRFGTIDTIGAVHDILLTKSANPNNEQLYIMTRNDGATPGALNAYTLLTGKRLSYTYPGLLTPTAVTGNSTRIFVLDQGDSALARAFRPSSGRRDSNIVNFQYCWRVREFFPDGGDTVSTFTDTTMAWVQGIAVDDQQRIYVSGIYILVTVNPDNPFYYYRRNVWRVFRYVKGGTDSRMPGAGWHRDDTYAVEEGSGLGTASDPRGIDWSPADGGALYIADSGNNRAQRRSDPPSAFDYLLLDGESGAMIAPVDIYADLDGFSYVIDSGHEAVYRFRNAGAGIGEYVQRVDVDAGASGIPLRRPIAVAADKDLVYVADGDLNLVAMYRRLK